MIGFKDLLRSILILGLFCGGAMSHARAAEPKSDTSTVPVIQRGFNAWERVGDAGVALNEWKKGGLMERSSKIGLEAAYFQRMGPTLGKYQSFDMISAKPVSKSSEVVYLSVNFEHGVVFGRFLLYRSDKGWVVQDMDFSARPEAVMPWLSFEGGGYTD